MKTRLLIIIGIITVITIATSSFYAVAYFTSVSTVEVLPVEEPLSLDHMSTANFKKDLPNFNKKACEEFNGILVDNKMCKFTNSDELFQFITVTESYDGNGYGEMDEYREYHCTEYDGTWDTKRKTCNDSESACLILDSDYISQSFEYSCESGEMPSCPVIIESKEGCVFENSIGQQLRENIGINIVALGGDQYDAYIEGKHAENARKYLDKPCDDPPSFKGYGYDERNLISFDYTYKNQKYEFKIIDDILFLRDADNTNTYTNISRLYDTVVPLVQQKLSDENDSVLFTPYVYEDVCGFPIPHEVRLDVIRNNGFFSSGDRIPFLTLQPGELTHVVLSKWDWQGKPRLHYWFELERGGQVDLSIEVCDVKGTTMSLGKVGPTYLKPSGEYPENTFDTLNIPGHPLVDKFTMESVLDVDNCNRVAEYYTNLQADFMYNRENVNFDALWADQVFPLMDYCEDTGYFKINIIDGKIDWSFTEK